MIIKNSEKWEYYNCPNCNGDISQEEIDVLHCNGCNNDINSVQKKIEILSAPNISTIIPLSISDEEIERLRIQTENISKGITA